MNAERHLRKKSRRILSEIIEYAARLGGATGLISQEGRFDSVAMLFTRKSSRTGHASNAPRGESARTCGNRPTDRTRLTSIGFMRLKNEAAIFHLFQDQNDMNIQTLEEKIAKRAGTVVQAKIKVFKAEIEAALNKLLGASRMSCESFGNYEYADTVDVGKNSQYEIAFSKYSVLKLAIQDEHVGPPRTKKLWPRVLWDMEIENIRNELLEKMDLMQQLLVSKSQPSDDDVPREF